MNSIKVQNINNSLQYPSPLKQCNVVVVFLVVVSEMVIDLVVVVVLVVVVGLEVVVVGLEVAVVGLEVVVCDVKSLKVVTAARIKG